MELLRYACCLSHCHCPLLNPFQSAVIGFTRECERLYSIETQTLPQGYVALQYGKQGVRCNSISPGVILTESA
jgi:hypothetical protein